jgi:excisionase family DNA binding protein
MMTLDQLASYLKLSPRTIHRLLEKNTLPFAMKIQGSWRFREEDVVDWLKNHKISECFNPDDVDQLIEGCNIFNEKIKILMSLLQPLSKLSISSKSQMFLVDLLIELFENPHGHIYLHHPDIRKLYEYILPRLNEDVAACAHCVYDKLRSLYRTTLYNKELMQPVLALLETRFSTLKKGHEDFIEKIVRRSVDPCLLDFLKDRKESIDEFKRHFPNTHQLFIHPLESNSSYHSIPLYIFYCNPVFFGWFCSYLSNLDKNGRARGFIERLETFLQKLPEVLDEENRQIFLRKIEEVVISTKKSSLHEISDKAYGAYAEMLYLEKHMHNLIKADFSIDKIEIPAHAAQKICDFRLISKELCRIVEIKGKTPGHGVDGSLGVLNDFLINYTPSLVNLLHYVCPEIELSELFPSLVCYEPADYEVPMAISKFIFRQRVIDRNLTRKKIKRKHEQELISDILYSLYDAHIPLSMGQRIGEDQERLQQKMSLAESLYEKEFIENTISNALEKFRVEKEWAQQTSHNVDSYVLCWLFSIPSSLIVDVYAEDDTPTLTLRENIQRRIVETCLKAHLKAFPDLENERVEIVFLS